jgi:hypothetical protein
MNNRGLLPGRDGSEGVLRFASIDYVLSLVELDDKMVLLNPCPQPDLSTPWRSLRLEELSTASSFSQVGCSKGHREVQWPARPRPWERIGNSTTKPW